MTDHACMKTKSCHGKVSLANGIRIGSLGCLAIIFLVLLSVRNEARATTYNELMKRATTEEKPVQMKTEEESPVLVSYEVGDTSDFYTQKEKTSFVDEESEWEDWEAGTDNE